MPEDRAQGGSDQGVRTIQGALAGLAALVMMGRLNSSSAAMGEGMARGRIGVAVFRDRRSMGADSAEALIMDLNGKTDEIPRVLYTDLRVLDSVDPIRVFVPTAMLDIDARLAQ